MPSLPLTSGPVAEVLEAGEREEGKETGGSASEQDYLEFIAEEGVCVCVLPAESHPCTISTLTYVVEYSSP